mmetsp:Transcript_25073/g.71595  ORF Transcript_25073/g.71595 Transcript_25073/m.71595 type:complete len:271 (-) Transcript_25073:2963-3775(-)
MLLGNESSVNDVLGRCHGNLSARQSLSSVIVGISLDVHRDTLCKSEAERLTSMSINVYSDSVVGQAILAISGGNFVRKHSTKCAVSVLRIFMDDYWCSLLKRVHCLLDQNIILGNVKPVVLTLQVANSSIGVELGCRCEQRAEVKISALVVSSLLVVLQVLSLSDHLLHRTVSELGHDFADLFCEQEKVVHDMFRLSGELLSKFLVLSGNTDWTSVQMTLSHHDAAHGNQRSSRKSEFLRSKQTGNRNITTSLDLTVSLKFDSVTEAVQH